MTEVSNLDDVVWLGDYALEFEVIEEVATNRHGDPLGTPDPPGTPENNKALPSDYIGRRLTIRVDDVVWQGPRYRPPQTLTFTDWGWLPEDDRKAVVGPDGIRLQVGRTYVGVFKVQDSFDPENPEYALVNSSTVFEVQDGGDMLIVDGRQAVADKLSVGEETTVDDFGRLLESAEGHPELEQLEDARLLDRMVALDPPVDDPSSTIQKDQRGEPAVTMP